MALSIRHVVFLIIAGQLFLQLTANAQSHKHTSTPTIDGALNPALIPDSLAYRLYLFSVSTPANSTDVDLRRQQVQLMKTGMAESDRGVFAAILTNFRSRYDALVAEYNDSAKAALARNETTDVHILLKQLDDLVQSTRQAISARLTPEGAAQLHSFILSEKRNMKIQSEGQ